MFLSTENKKWKINLKNAHQNKDYYFSHSFYLFIFCIGFIFFCLNPPLPAASLTFHFWFCLSFVKRMARERRNLTHFMVNETKNHVGEPCTKAAINRPAFITLIDFLTSRYSSVKSSTRKGNDVTRPLLSSVCKCSER